MGTTNYNALPEHDAKPSFVFELGPREWHCKSRSALPLSIVRILQTSPEGGGDRLVQIGEFFSAVLVPDEVDAFLEMIDSPRSPLNFENAGPLLNDAIAALSGRPTKRPSSSGAGPRRTTARSGGASTSRGTPRSR